MQLTVPTKQDVELVRQWRNKNMKNKNIDKKFKQGNIKEKEFARELYLKGLTTLEVGKVIGRNQSTKEFLYGT